MIAAVACVVLPPQPAGSQATLPGREAGADVHTVSGRVLRPGPNGLRPVTGQWVVLHRLGSDRAGPLDSMRTDSRGAYRFRFVPGGDERALYFAAASYAGVAYFTPPLADHSVTGEAAEIVVYDTTTREIPISVRGRHIVVAAADADAQRTVMEIYELANDTTVTRVSPLPDSPPTWRTTLPAAAHDMRVTAGDVPADAVTFDHGEVRLITPLSPGVKQLAYSYRLPASVFPLSVPTLEVTDVLEILVEEPVGQARGREMAEVEPVIVDGRSFRRFLAQDVQPGAVAVIDIPRQSRRLDPRYIVALTLLVGGAMLLAVAHAVRK